MDLKLYEKIASLPGISSRERIVGKFIKEELEKNAEEVLVDGFGGVFGRFGSTGPVVMICAHMDEIGCMVSEVTPKGFLKVIPIGGINPEVLVSSLVDVHGKEVVRGVFSSVPPHISKDSKLTFNDLLVDIGADSKDDVLALGIKQGTMVTPVANFYTTYDGKKLVSKAWDDRLGCAICLDIASKMKNIKHDSTVYLGATVMEEVGLRGAKVATNMINPDLFITVDVSPAGDYLDKNEGVLGNGFLVRYFDPGCIMSPELLNYFEELANANSVKFQYFKSAGGTDAGAAQYAGNGTLATTIGLPGRYIHSPATMVHVDDIEAAVKFIVKLIEDFDQNRLNELKDIYK